MNLNMFSAILIDEHLYVIVFCVDPLRVEKFIVENAVKNHKIVLTQSHILCITSSRCPPQYIVSIVQISRTCILWYEKYAIITGQKFF